MKLREWKWTCPTYHTPIALLHGEPEDVAEWAREMFGPNFAHVLAGHDSSARTSWVVMSEGGYALVIWLTPDFDARESNWLGTLVHETQHATHFVMSAIGMKLTDASEEAYTYHQGALFKACHERLVGKPRRVERKAA